MRTIYVPRGEQGVGTLVPQQRTLSQQTSRQSGIFRRRKDEVSPLMAVLSRPTIKEWVTARKGVLESVSAWGRQTTAVRKCTVDSLDRNFLQLETKSGVVCHSFTNELEWHRKGEGWGLIISPGDIQSRGLLTNDTQSGSGALEVGVGLRVGGRS